MGPERHSQQDNANVIQVNQYQRIHLARVAGQIVRTVILAAVTTVFMCFMLIIYNIDFCCF